MYITRKKKGRVLMFRRLLDKFNRFMYGRYGSDQLFFALIILYVIFILMARIFSGIFVIFAYAAFFISMFRYFSKNIYKRREENRKFLGFWQKIKNYFIDNYDEEIWDGDLQCIDMYYYSKDLKK